jgi:8-oxo-dGTP pyrophosphatase MutT (NUDIX family)
VAVNAGQVIENFLGTLGGIVGRYLGEVAEKGEHLSLLRWQIAEGHALDRRATLPGHVTTSAFVVSPDHAQVLLIDHRTIGRWLQPGGHWEPAESFSASAAREAIEETAVAGLQLHHWHRGSDLPLVIDSHDVPGKASRNEAPHIHHDLQYLFVADPALRLIAQEDEVSAAAWYPLEALAEISPKGLRRIRAL